MDKNKSKNGPASLPEYIRQLQQRGVPETQFKRYADQYIEFKARENKIPLHGSFELTPLCNFDCKMCYVHLTNNEFDQNQLLSIEVWKKLIKEACDLGMRNVTLTGGECLTYPNFSELYSFVKEQKLKCAILTNGALINEGILDLFLETPPELIQITLYGSSNKTYYRVTGREAFSTVYNNIIKLKEAGLPIIISVTPNAYMLNDMYSLIKLVESMDIPYHINSGLIEPRKNTGRKKTDFTSEQYIGILRIRSNLRNDVLSPMDYSELPDAQGIGSKRYGFSCGGGRSTFTIKYDGFMCPCPAFEDISANVLKDGVSGAWMKINREVEQYLLPEECGECIYKPYCLKCTAVHKNAPKGHCDPTVCERTKLMISAGLTSFRVIHHQ